MMKCRPELKTKSKPVEAADNMEIFGQICEKMLHVCHCKLKQSETAL